MSNFNAEDLLRIRRALKSHEESCRDIASEAHDLGQRSTVAAMCKEAAEAAQLRGRIAEAQAAPTRPCRYCNADAAPGSDCCTTDGCARLGDESHAAPTRPAEGENK